MTVPQLGERLAQYEILSAIGAGGMGRVFRARDTRLRREVALKVLSPEHAGDPEMRSRFEREARSVAALAHPGIVAIHDLGMAGGAPFIVMELLDGTNLRQRLDAGAVPLASAVEIIAQVAGALGAVHAAGIVHRDLKPENVFLTRSSSVKLLDFGLARRAASLGTGLTDTGDQGLTGPNVLIGTLRYMSPEQARGETPTEASDVFSLGLLLYELTTGRYAFEADTAIGALHGVVHDSPLAPSSMNPAIPSALEALTLEMLAKDPALRPGAAEAATRLRAIEYGGGAEAAVRMPPAVVHHTVGRGAERETLHAAWAAARAGQSSLVSVSGEPGIGKTTLVEDFLSDISGPGTACLVGRGRCSETLAGAEAYLPVLEVLETLVRRGGEPVQRLLKKLAPAWHLQVAPLASTDSSAERVRQDIRSASQQRVKRELRAFLQEISRTAPVVLFIDDVHWADPPTVDLLAYIARGLDGMRLLIVTTHRVSELLLARHPFASLSLDLQTRGLARDLPLPFLAPADVERYLDLEFPGHELPPAFATLVHTRTEGNPLFMADLLADLRGRGIIRCDPAWRLAEDMSAIEQQLPASIRSMIQRRLDHVDDQDLRLLRIASLQGYRFDALVIAEAAETSAMEVEDRLDALDRVHGLVRLVEERGLPDGAVTARYQFVHVLYQNALHASLTPARRSALCAAIARSLESHHARQPGPVAARVAHLFESAREHRAAARAYSIAAEHAGQLVAHQEAAGLARRGLTLVQELPETRDRAELELPLLLTLGVALLVTEGYASSDGRRAYVRARELCLSLGDRTELFPVMWGLWIYAICTADYAAALDLSNELMRMAEHGRPQDRVRAAWASGTTAMHHGDPVSAIRTFEWGLESYREEDDRLDRHVYGHDAGITCRAFGAFARWFLGQEEAAIAGVESACDAAVALSHPQSQAFAFLIAANVHRCRADVERTFARATDAVLVSEREGLPQFREWGRAQLGWAVASRGQVDEGLAMMTEALEALFQMGSAVGRPYFSAGRADILATHRPSEAMEMIDYALNDACSSGELMYYPELLRLKAEVLAAQGNHAAACRQADAAVAAATRQGAVALLARAQTTARRLTAQS
jgi:hypothetical protein